MRDRYSALREEAWEANLMIPAMGLAILTWGNASSFDPGLGAFAIKPSGLDYTGMRSDDMVVLDLEGNQVSGKLRPSSDTPTHLALYRGLKDIRGVCHAHSSWACAWAQARRAIPLLGTTHADLVAGPVPCTAMIREEAVARGYEAATGDLILETIAAGASAPGCPVILVAGHGPFGWGPSARKAVEAMAALEEVARMAARTFALEGGAEPLPAYLARKHFERKHGKDAYYGQIG